MTKSDKVTFAKDSAPAGSSYVPYKPNIGTLDYSTSECADSDSQYISNLMAESLNIAGGPVNVFPMLGVYDQGSTVDQTGAGYPLSSGTPAGYSVAAAFHVDDLSWRSVQQGQEVIDAPAFVGYSFGTKKAWVTESDPDTERYFPAEPVRRKISTLKIKQGQDPRNRVTQVRVEASDDGSTWHRVDIVNLPDSNQLVTIGVRAVAEWNQWRLIPTFFNGIADNFQWEIVELHLLESTQLSLDNIEDFLLLENRDRSYCRASKLLKGTYDLLDVQTELAKFGINLPQTYIFTVSFNSMVTVLGRPVIVGDIVELPGEVQYDQKLRPVRKWLEVTDCSWSTEGYTPNWKPQLYRFYAQPILPSVEHKDILGLPGVANAAVSDSDFLINALQQNDNQQSTEAIAQASKEAVPQDGSDPQDIQSGKPLIKARGVYDGNDLYSEDALPPNGAPYTFGDTLPDPETIEDGHYHRQTYTQVDARIRPPDRLLRWFAANGRWRVIEVNKRSTPESHKKTIAKLMSSSSSQAPDKKP